MRRQTWLALAGLLIWAGLALAQVRIVPTLYINGGGVARGSVTLPAAATLIFEGATDDAFETIVTSTDVGADVTLTLPGLANVSGALLATTLTTNDVDAANSVWGVSNGLRFEGLTADAFETTLAPTDVGADVTLTLPGLGNVAGAVLASTLTTNDADAANSLWGVSNGLRFEGLTADAFETTLSPTDVGADITLTLPGLGNASGAILASTLTTNDLDAANAIWAESNNLVFEGLTGGADAFETRLTVTDPTADRVATFPDLTGTVALSGASQAVAFATVDTGQGAYELYQMDQNVDTGASPTFVGLNLSGALQWTDTSLVRIAANRLGLRNGTNAQILDLFETWTDASNFARVYLAYDGGTSTWILETSAAGTGAHRPLRLSTAGSARLQLGANNSIHAFVDPYGLFGYTKQTVTVADGGVGATAFNLTPSESYIEVICNDADGCNATMIETNMQEGTCTKIVNVSAANVVNFADTAGVSEIAGAFAAGAYDAIELCYDGVTWYENSRSNN